MESFVPDYLVTYTLTENNGNEPGDELNNLPSSAGNEVFSIAPGEGKHPIHFMQDKHCEELAFPVLFPKGQFGYQVEREVRLSPTKYFNARLLNYTGRFAANPEYLFLPSTLLNKKSAGQHIYSTEKGILATSYHQSCKKSGQKDYAAFDIFRPSILFYEEYPRVTSLQEEFFI